ncbi:MAG TPA: hypothetical protein VF266_26770 [Thermoanaerobaculia bacterium]
MTKIHRYFLLTLLAATLALPAYAYNDRVTHNDMSVIAAEKSVLYTDPSIMYSLGLLPIDRQAFVYTGTLQDIQAGEALYTAGAIVGRGAIDEDSGNRPLHHFYDPVYERGMGIRSWVWMTEPLISLHDRSLPDARDFLTRGLTFNEGGAAASLRERQNAVSTMLLSLGHAVHHMQDMAQPQHVRHDQHLEWISSWRSRYEYYTRDRADFIRMLAMSATPMFPGSPEFKKKTDFWANSSGTGIAQRVNRDFVSQGTNFTLSLLGNVNTSLWYSNPQPGGATNYTPAQLFGASIPAGIQSLCSDPEINCTMTMYSTPMTQRASTLSIFDQDLHPKGLEVKYVLPGIGPVLTGRLFDLNRFNFDAVHPELVQRAVSYSTGIINHFFRGRLEVTPPATTVYAVADHSAGQGFAKMRAAVKNITPGEALAGGKIRAIARFYRNGCYKPDLSGEWQQINGVMTPPCPSFRLPYAEIRVSDEQEVTIAAGESKELTFNFATPVPFDAIDVMLQVYYTGTVGEEGDSFALGAADVSEPTFVAFLNATDYFELSGNYYPWQQIIDNIAVAPYSTADVDDNKMYNSPPDVRVTGGPISFDIWAKNGVKMALSNPPVPPGRFMRIAALVAPDRPFEIRDQIIDGPITVTSPSVFSPRIYQMINDQFSSITPVAKRRGLFQFNTTTWHRYHPIHTANVNLMPPSQDPDAATPVPALITGFVAMSAPSASEWTKSMAVFDAMREEALAPMLRQDDPAQSLLQPASPLPMQAVPAAPAVHVSHAAASQQQ